MFRAVIVVLVALTLLGAGRQFAGWWQRQRLVRQIDPDSIQRMARGVSLRALVTGVKTWRGLDSRRRTALRGDLVRTDDRFLLVTNRGVFVDLTEGGQTLRSVRCTGPGRLVIEGETGREDGIFRFELVIEDAQGWAAELAAFVGEEGAKFASFRGSAS